MPTTSTDAAELRLLSWNVRSLRDGVEAVAAVIRDAAVDVALICEAPRLARWRSRRAAMAREAGLLVGTADRVGGLCVLTSPRTWVLEHDHIELPTQPNRHRRALVTATVAVAGAVPWRVAVTHLGLDAPERLRHAHLVDATLRVAVRSGTTPTTTAAGRLAVGDQPPVVLGADLNESPGAPAWTALTERLRDAFADRAAPTYPAGAPTQRIDAVLVSAGVQMLGAEVVDARGASDHRPLVVTLRRGS